MADSPGDGRHLTVATLHELWKSGVPIVLPIDGAPACRLELDPQLGLIRLLTAHQTPEPDVAKLKNVQFRAVVSGGEEVAELSVRTGDDVYAAYGLLASIADDLQVEQESLAASVAGAVARHRTMLVSLGGLTLENEIGLVGELLFLEFLIGAVGAELAVSTWHGPLSEEHDFLFDDVHIEVKTTAGEQRKHKINGVAQLVPIPGVPLSLLSIQLTRSAGTTGRTLPELVDAVRGAVGGHLVRLDALLASSGWLAEEADLYSTRWAFRTPPRAFAVESDFPAITAERLAPVVPNFPLVSEVSYKIDLTSFTSDSVPGVLAGFIAIPGEADYDSA